MAQPHGGGRLAPRGEAWSGREGRVSGGVLEGPGRGERVPWRGSPSHMLPYPPLTDSGAGRARGAWEGRARPVAGVSIPRAALLPVSRLQSWHTSLAPEESSHPPPASASHTHCVPAFPEEPEPCTGGLLHSRSGAPASPLLDTSPWSAPSCTPGSSHIFSPPSLTTVDSRSPPGPPRGS